MCKKIAWNLHLKNLWICVWLYLCILPSKIVWCSGEENFSDTVTERWWGHGYAECSVGTFVSSVVHSVGHKCTDTIFGTAFGENVDFIFSLNELGFPTQCGSRSHVDWNKLKITWRVQAELLCRICNDQWNMSTRYYPIDEVACVVLVLPSVGAIYRQLITERNQNSLKRMFYL